MTIEEFGQGHNRKWDEILSAKTKSESESDRKLIRDEIFGNGFKLFDNDMDLVIFGSIVRNECTIKSDVDWTLLIDGQSNPNQTMTK